MDSSDTSVLQDWQATGLRSPSAFRALLVTLPPTAITAQIGRTAPRDWQDVVACVQTAIGK
jgi:hypothetical protein